MLVPAPALDEKESRRRAETYLRRLGGRAPRVTDKTPSNFRLIGHIQALFPEAAIVHCRRDAADVCLSCFTTQFARGHEWSNDHGDLGRYHQGYARLMQHWDEMLPGRLLHLAYEDLVADPEPAIRRLLDHCRLPWSEACLHPHAAGTAVTTASRAQVRRPIYTSSVGRWRHYRKHLGPLLELLGRSGT